MPCLLFPSLDRITIFEKRTEGRRRVSVFSDRAGNPVQQSPAAREKGQPWVPHPASPLCMGLWGEGTPGTCS